MECEAGCGRRPKRAGLCWACIKCLQRRGTTVRKKPHCGTRYEDAEEMLAEAVINLKDAEDKATAHRRYMIAHLRYLRRRNTVHRTTDTLP